MRLKTYRCETVQSAVRLAKIELGEEAVFLGSREVEGGGQGRFEVSFARLESSAEQPPPSQATESSKVVPYHWKSYLSAAGSLGTAAAAAPAQTPNEKADEAEAAPSVALPTPSAGPTAPPEPAEAGRARLEGELCGRGLEARLAARLLDGWGRGDGGPMGYEELRNRFRASENAIWRTDPTLGRASVGPRVAAVVGPPGCGKTSAIAKLSIRYGIARRCSVQLVSVDQIRVGAVEPLEAYATLLATPVCLIDSPESLSSELRRLCLDADCPDLVLLDTPGYARSEGERLEKLASALEEFGEIDVHLALPADMRDCDLKRVVERYEAFHPDKLLLTKLDETDTPGAALGAHLASGTAISFLSSGQRAPEDLSPASASALTGLLLGQAGAASG